MTWQESFRTPEISPAPNHLVAPASPVLASETLLSPEGLEVLLLQWRTRVLDLRGRKLDLSPDPTRRFP